MTFAPAQLESALARVEAIEDASARAVAGEAISAVLELHGQGLRHLCDLLREINADAMREVAERDPLVASLLLLHGLHPLPLEARVRQALASVPALDHARVGEPELTAIDGAVVRLRLAGNAKLRQAVARAVKDAAPEVEQVDVLGPDPSIIPISRLRRDHEATRERCDLCSEGLTAEHEHLFDPEQRKLKCACRACLLLFDGPGSKLRRVRRRAQALEGFRISAEQWAALKVPVGLVFFSHSSQRGQVMAAYPGPAGAMESVVPNGAWENLVKDNPALVELEADVAALLVDRLSAPPTYHIVSIDQCYRLTGLVRSHWQGMTGGDGPVRAVAALWGRAAGERA